MSLTLHLGQEKDSEPGATAYPVSTAAPATLLVISYIGSFAAPFTQTADLC